MNYVTAVYKLKQLNKKMKKNKQLEEYFSKWLEKHYNTTNEQELLNEMEKNPEIIKDIVIHWEEIKKDW